MDSPASEQAFERRTSPQTFAFLWICSLYVHILPHRQVQERQLVPEANDWRYEVGTKWNKHEQAKAEKLLLGTSGSHINIKI